MLAEGLRQQWRGAVTLLLAFGLWGVAVWPATGWLAYQLLHKEVAGMNGLHVNRQALIGRDFVNIWHGGQEAIAHGAHGVYDWAAYRRTLFAKWGFAGLYAYSYPPHMLLLSVPFGLFTYVPAYALWTILGLCLFWFAARPWLRDVGLPSWSVLVLPATFVNLWAGHFGFLIGALALYGWWRAQTQPVRGGLAFALMTVKPHMGVLVPLLLLLRARWRTILWAGLGTVGLVALSTLIFGTWAWEAWLMSTLEFQAGLIEVVPRQPYSFMMPTVGRLLYSWTDDPVLVLTGQILAGLYAVAVPVWAWRHRVGVRDLGMLGIIATPLILPYSFNYDMVALSLLALVCAVRWKTGWLSPDRLLYSAAFLIPLALEPLARQDWWPTPVILLLLLTLAAWRMVQEVKGVSDPVI